jgi:hypothetical protein
MTGLTEIPILWDTFNFRVWCVIGPHRYLPAYVKKRHRRSYKAKATADCRGLYFKSRPKQGGILWLDKTPRSPKEIGYLTHEVGHAVVDMHAQRGLNLDPDNDETFCYAIAHGVTSILEGLKK